MVICPMVIRFGTSAHPPLVVEVGIHDFAAGVFVTSLKTFAFNLERGPPCSSAGRIPVSQKSAG